MTDASKHSNDESWDSIENWVFIVLSFTRKEFAVLSRIVKHVVPKVKHLKEEEKITNWHFRYGSRGADVTFRLRCLPQHRDETRQILNEIADELEKKDLVRSHDTERDPAWITSDDQMREEYEHPSNWSWLIECDELLSEVAYRAMTHEDPYGKLVGLLHELLNMFGMQELGGFFVFRPMVWDRLDDILEVQSASNLKDAHDFRRDNFVGKQLKLRKQEHEQPSDEIIERWKKELEGIWEDNWKKTSLMAIFFHSLL